MDDRTIYIEVSRGLWRTALLYKRLPPDQRRLGPRSATNREMAHRLAENAGLAAKLALSASTNEEKQ